MFKEGSLRRAGVTDPCGLWHESQLILKSVINPPPVVLGTARGMCELRISVAIFWMWHVPQVSVIVSRTSPYFGDTSSMTLWQFVHATSRDSCELPDQKMRLPLVWHCRQIALRLSTGVLSLLANVIRPPLPLPPPASTWAWPGPWQFSQASPSTLLRGWWMNWRPIFVRENFSNCSAWHSLHV